MNKSSLRVASAIAALSAVFAFPASATVSSFSALLSNVGEPNPTSPATGSATVELDDVALSVDVHVNFANLTANATAMFGANARPA